MESKGPGPCAGWRESVRFAHVCALFTWHGPIIVSYGNVFVCNRLKLEIFIDVVSSLFLNEYRLMHKKGPYTISWQERRRSDCALRSLICAFLPSSKNHEYFRMYWQIEQVLISQHECTAVSWTCSINALWSTLLIVADLKYTLFDLTTCTVHTHISAHSSNLAFLRLQPVYSLCTWLLKKQHMLWVLIWIVSTGRHNLIEYQQRMLSQQHML